MQSMITTPTIDDFEELTQLWEASVRSTHHFLSEEDIQFLRPLVQNDYLPAVELYVIKNEENKITSFIGLSEELIEMLFVHPDEQGKGYGSALMDFAIQEKKRYKVDVNEQNEKARQFYQNKGFRIVGRDELDAQDKPFPILHLERVKQ